MKRFFYLIFLLYFIFSVSVFANKNEKPQAVKGILDLRNWDLRTDGSIALNGEWEFYWEQFVDPLDIQNNRCKLTGFFNFPGYWNDKIINQTELKGSGYATIRLKILPNRSNHLAAISLKEIQSAYKLWYNSNPMAKNGSVGRSFEEMKPEYIPQTVTLLLDKDTCEIVIQASNFNHKLGGFFDEIQLGTPTKIFQDRIKMNAYDLFLFGSLLMMGIYHFGLFFQRRKEKSTLYFGILCVLVAFRILVTREQFLSFVFPTLSWDLNYKIEYFSFILAPVAFLTFLQSIFKDEVNKRVILIFQLIGLTFSLIVLFTQTRIFSYLSLPYQLILFVGIIYSGYVLFVAIRRKRVGSIVLMIGIIIMLVTTLNDIFYMQEVFKLIELTPMGLFLFILCQSFVLSLRFSKAYKENEDLTVQLEFQNKNLENIVLERTSEINQQKEEIMAQRDRLETAYTDLSYKNKQITDSIEYAKRIQSALLPRIKVIKEALPESFVFYLPRDVVSGDFFWFSKQDDKVFFAAVDCTGHGVPGGFMSMIGHSLLNEIVNEKKVFKTSMVLEMLNARLMTSMHQHGYSPSEMHDDGMEISFCCYEPLKNFLTFANTNQPVLIIKNNISEVVQGDLYSIGEAKDEKCFNDYIEKKIIIDTETSIYIFSDGFADQFGGDNDQKYTMCRFQNFLFNIHAFSMDKQNELLKNELLTWKGNSRQIDDVLVMGVKLFPKQ